MTGLQYHKSIKGNDHKESIRFDMVQDYLNSRNSSAIARTYQTKRQTVDKWVERYQKEGTEGLKDKRRAPHTVPSHKSSTEVEQAVIALVRSKKYRIGQDRIRTELPDHLKRSTATINRIMHQHDLIKKRKDSVRNTKRN